MVSGVGRIEEHHGFTVECFFFLQAFDLNLRREYTEHYLCKQVLNFIVVLVLFVVDRWPISI